MRLLPNKKWVYYNKIGHRPEEHEVAFFEKFKGSSGLFIGIQWVQEKTLHRVAPFLKNGDLNKHWKELENYSEEHLVDAIIHLAKGLETLHSAGWEHRDLGFQNILVQNDGLFIVADFDQTAPIREGRKPCKDMSQLQRLLVACGKLPQSSSRRLEELGNTINPDFPPPISEVIAKLEEIKRG